MSVFNNDANVQQKHLLQKYRPREIEDMSLDVDMAAKMKEYIDSKSCPHLLFYGNSGTGKSTLAEIIINKLSDDVHYKEVNASDLRGIDAVRDLQGFVEAATYGDVKRILFLDEFDGMTQEAYRAFRNLTNIADRTGCIIIATCNYLQQILKEVRSRFEIHYFKPLEDEEMMSYCKKILDGENIDYKEEEVLQVINRFKPDMRDIIKEINKLTLDGKFLFDESKLSVSRERQLLEACISLFTTSNISREVYEGHMNTINNILKEDPEQVKYNWIFNNLMINENISAGIKVVINQYINRIGGVLSLSLNFLSMIYAVFFTRPDDPTAQLKNYIVMLEAENAKLKEDIKTMNMLYGDKIEKEIL